MEHQVTPSTSSTAPQRQPVQLRRAKDDAKRLAQWTGEPLSKCQELTARALGATSWQALLKNPTFVPDEELLDRETGEPIPLERYREIGHLLAESLDVCDSLGRVIAAFWQPTATTPTPYFALRAGDMHRHMADRRESLLDGDATKTDAYLVHVFDAHQDLPPGYSLALVAQHKVSRRVLVAVKPGRLALYMRWSDCIALTDGSGMARKENTADDFTALTSVEISRLTRFYSRPKSFYSFKLKYGLPSEPEPHVKLQAAWLKRPMAVSELRRTFATFAPWSAGKFKVQGADSASVWAMAVKGVLVEIKSVIESSWPVVDIKLHVTSPSRESFQCFLQSATIEYHDSEFVEGPGLTMRADRHHPPGAYVLRDGAESNWEPDLIPELDAEDLKDVAAQTGLGRRGPQVPIEAIRNHRFYESNAGLAYAAWLANLPDAELQDMVEMDKVDPYAKSTWLSNAASRMLFELARAHKIDD